jgi:protein-L-isoaspartate(D-aspartate) O-methyltransferase
VSAEHAVDPVAMIAETLPVPPQWLGAVGDAAPEWSAAFEAMRREWFVPRIVWRRDPHGRGWLAVDRTDDSEAWAGLVARDDSVVTQVDDGHPSLHGGVGRAPSSSTSMPSVMAVMLHALDVDPRTAAGMRVLEVGTGTGWNTALLAYRVGDEHVTSVEIDPDICARAQKALADAGHGAVTVITGDGTLGCPENAPYDRVLCTAACHRVPYAWVRQCAPGGVIVTPWQTPYLASALLRLTVTHDGVASGRFVANAAFMSLRGQRVGDWVPNPEREPDAAESVTSLYPYAPVSDYDGCAFAVSLLVPGIEKSIVFDDPHDRRTFELLVYDEPTRSWATVNVTPTATDTDDYPVRQHGPRRLWDEIVAAHHWWKQHDSPQFTEFGLTVSPQGQHAWLGDPTHPIHPICRA